ncbi:hypothetical protein [Mesorhizobium sp. KR9-304]|uniref:hypothetical protein n=1 Tax=Mesorhizobium sp. KR9-304 TaxID=3156614 RepID=UPI0032B565BB
MAHDLNLPSIADAQADGQWQSSNDGDAALANAVQDILSVDFSGGNVTLTSTQFRSAFCFIPSGLSANRDLTIPGVKRAQFMVDNTDTTETITVKRGSTSIAVAAGHVGIFNTDGTTNSLGGFVVRTGAPSLINSAYDFGMTFGSTPATDEVLGRVRIGRNITIPANMSGASGGVSVNPTATFDIDVLDDGVSIGTISVSTGGAATFTTTSGTAKTVAAGSEIRFDAPTTPDATVEGGSFVILATVTS